MWLAPDNRAISVNLTYYSCGINKTYGNYGTYGTYGTYESYESYGSHMSHMSHKSHKSHKSHPGLAAILPDPAVSQPLSFDERLASDFAVVEINFAGRQNLIGLVPFAGDQDHVSRPRLHDRAEDGFAAIDHQIVMLADARQADPDVIQDQQRVFTAGVVRGRDHEVAQPRRLFPHERAFGPVTIPAAAEDRNHAASGTARALVVLRVAHGPQHAGYRVRRVRVIDDDRDVLTARAVRAVVTVLAVCGDALEPARNAAALIDAARYRLIIEAQRKSDPYGAEYVVGVRASDQR